MAQPAQAPTTIEATARRGCQRLVGDAHLTTPPFPEAKKLPALHDHAGSRMNAGTPGYFFAMAFGSSIVRT